MKVKVILFLVFVSVLFTYPFFQTGYFATQDGEWAIVRLTEMSREIRDLQIPPRWSDYLNHGYGYPLFLFTYPLPYYFGELIHFIGFDFTDTIKILFILSVIIGGIGMYFFSRRFFGDLGGVISSVFYITMPYRLVDLYVRGSLGESIALAIVPWLFWTTDKFLKKNTYNGILISILFAFLILSHNSSAFFYSLLLICYLICFKIKQIKGIITVIKPYFMGLLISCFFWLPALVEKKFTFLEHYPLADKTIHYALLSDLFTSKYITNPKPPLFLGYPQIAVLIYSVFIVIFILKDKKIKKTLTFYIISILISLILVFPVSTGFWLLPGFSSIDFPWRILIVTGFLLSFISGSLVFISKSITLGCVIIIAAIVINLPLVRVTDKIMKNDTYYETNDATTTSADELMPIWVTLKPSNRPINKVETVSGDISQLSNNSKSIRFIINSKEDQQITLNTLYFPGWQFWLDNKKTESKPAEKTGLIALAIPEGVHLVQGLFLRTPIRVFSDLVSVLGILWLSISFINITKKYN